MESVSICNCGFMHLRGDYPGYETLVAAGPVTVAFDSQIDATGIPDLLSRASEHYEFDSHVTFDEIFGGLALWLALHDPRYCTLSVVWPRDHPPPMLLAHSVPSGDLTIGWSPGSFNGSSLAVLACTDGRLSVETFGDRTEVVPIAEHTRQWDRAGRPTTQSLRVRAHRSGQPIDDAERFTAIRRRWTTFLIDW
jgi:protein-L-isoaspartate(D-aspartate) O-methyltransferase